MGIAKMHEKLVERFLEGSKPKRRPSPQKPPRKAPPSALDKTLEQAKRDLGKGARVEPRTAHLALEVALGMIRRAVDDRLEESREQLREDIEEIVRSEIAEALSLLLIETPVGGFPLPGADKTADAATPQSPQEVKSARAGREIAEILTRACEETAGPDGWSFLGAVGIAARKIDPAWGEDSETSRKLTHVVRSTGAFEFAERGQETYIAPRRRGST